MEDRAQGRQRHLPARQSPGADLGPNAEQHEVGSGGLYNNQKNPHRALVVADNPVGEWNTFWIKMVGDKVTVKLNGKLVVDNTPLENYWERGKPLPHAAPSSCSTTATTCGSRTST